MSLTAIIWLLLFTVLCILSITRPVYACCAYLMTIFASPVYWWWGAGALRSLTMRWSLLAAVIVGGIVIFHWVRGPRLTRDAKKYVLFLLAFVFNAFLVNEFLASNPRESADSFDMLWKASLISVLIYFCLRELKDILIFMLAIVIGCTYVGFQVIINEAGTMVHGRLEDIAFPAAQGSNAVAAVMSMSLPLIGFFVVCGPTIWHRLFAVVASPFVLDTVLRCNSRGAYLGLIAVGAVVLFAARGSARKRAIMGISGGLLGLALLANNASIMERFTSIFVSAEERDGAASERLLYWEAALKMIADHPLGSGGEAAFRSELGLPYILHFRDNREFRSVHNGFLDVAAGWGVQGFTLFMFALGIPMLSLWRSSRENLLPGDEFGVFVGASLLAAIVGQLVCTMFTNVLDGEWYLWLTACCLAYARLTTVGREAMEYDDLLDEEEIDDDEIG